MRIATAQITFRAEFNLLNDVEAIKGVLRMIAKASKLQIVDHVRHSFEPQGHSVVFILSESHIAAHTWPESGTAYITLSSCSDMKIANKEIQKILEKALKATTIEIKEHRTNV